MREVRLKARNIVIGQQINPEKAAMAREFRRNMTFPEKLLWEKLRANRLNGHHFRRQQVISGYIVDFYCHEVGLVVEIDGSIHAEQVEQDALRDKALTELSLQVIRVSSDDVVHHMDAALSTILQACK